MDRPNILLIHSDQHRYDCLGCHDHPLLETPNLDRLAAEGADFAHAFTPQPVCSPARACLATGTWASTHGCLGIPDIYEAYRPADPELPTLWGLLREAGYVQAHVGKFHGETAGTPDREGADVFISEKAYPAWREAQGLAPPPRGGFVGATDPHVTPAQSRLGWGAERTIEQIESAAAGGKPFFIRWDPSEPHLPNIVPEAVAGLYPPERIPPWASFADTLAGKPEIQHQQRRTWEVEGWTWADWAPIVSRYLAEITLLDRQIGRLLETLDRLGLAQNTLVAYSTDHGDLCGGHGMIDKHYVMYDDVVRVPLIVRWPGKVSAGQKRTDFVSHELDLARTFLEAAGVEPPGSFAGRSLLADTGRADIYSQYHGAQFGLYSERMVRDARWKYVWNPTAVDELYDLAEDPGELVNRAADPACAGERARLRGRLVAWMEEVGDPLLNFWTRAQLEKGLKR
ncbi:MAG: sulfatase-like hydrolase/transferase [Phycisphaeraceae bacterium]